MIDGTIALYSEMLQARRVQKSPTWSPVLIRRDPIGNKGALEASQVSDCVSNAHLTSVRMDKAGGERGNLGWYNAVLSL